MQVMYKTNSMTRKTNKLVFCMLNHLQPDLQAALQQNCSAILLKTEKMERAAIIHDDESR